ncbi:MAG: hypothetical protein R2881_08695 [Eubacteriales bacterium]
MTNKDVIQRTDDNILGTYKRFPIALERGENTRRSTTLTASNISTFPAESASARSAAATKPGF